MSRRRERARARARPVRRKGAARAPWWAGASALAILAALAAWFVLRGPATPGRIRPREPVAADPLAGWDPAGAYARGLALGRTDQHLASVPFFRRAASAPDAPWQVRRDYCGALYNATLQLAQRHGVPVAVTRSSLERVSLMRQALAELDEADRLVPSPVEAAPLQSMRGRMNWLWGFPWETFVAMRQAQYADASRRDLAGLGDAFMDLMQHPEVRPGGPAGPGEGGTP